MVQRILIVEDEPSIAELIAVNLSHAGYSVERAMQSDEAQKMINHQLPDLIVLDWMLPGKSGVQLAKELRLNEKFNAIPILMLTAKGEEADKVTGLDAGADDYVTKPFSPKELIARVKALLRRYSIAPEEGPLALGPMTLDPATHRIMISQHGGTLINLALGPTEFRLLHFLMANPERVHSRANLLDHVWGNDTYIEERTVDVHVKRLRGALAPLGCDQFIETVRGSGYRITKTPIKA